MMEKNKSLQNYGWLAVTILSLVPLVLWFFAEPLSFRFSSLPLVLRSLGDVAGLCGMAMFALVLILSARLRIFEKFFRGINQSYNAHHYFGAIAFCLLLFHPLLLMYFLLPHSFAEGLGAVGLFLMIVTLAITFYTKLKYQTWKFTHKFLGIAFIFAFLHTFLIGADVAESLPLKIYLFVLGIVAIILYFSRTVFDGYLFKKFEYIVRGVKQHEDKIWEIEFEPKSKEMKFKSGQFAFIKIFTNGLTKEIHPFSFSSATGNPMKVAIKELGDYTNKIGSLKAGDVAIFEGPFGSFNFRNHANKKQIWIAGGIGVTPFLSMLRDFTEKDADYKVDLYYSVKDENCLAFKQEMESIAGKHKNINIKFWIASKNGFLSAEAIKKEIPDLLKERDILICGPAGMMAALKNQFLQQGLQKTQIHTEDFQLY